MRLQRAQCNFKNLIRDLRDSQEIKRTQKGLSWTETISPYLKSAYWGSNSQEMELVSFLGNLICNLHKCQHI